MTTSLCHDTWKGRSIVGVAPLVPPLAGALAPKKTNTCKIQVVPHTGKDTFLQVFYWLFSFFFYRLPVYQNQFAYPDSFSYLRFQVLEKIRVLTGPAGVYSISVVDGCPRVPD